ncbi:MAG: AAA family ATPase [Gemmatimonadota bacterium]|jgi:uncharacterized protein YhaN
MRIDRIRIGGFGRLHDFDTGAASLEDLVVVLGPNEAGKSTLFSFLTTALYGFQPATRERNPHVPWGTDEASGSIRVRLDSEGCAEVERKLRSQPSGVLTLDGRTSDLRNQSVPWVGHVPRTVFRQVFAITLGELAGLDGETWARIQDKMIGSMGATDLLSPRTVAEALEREAGEIWRPNRRGNQRLRELQSTLRELRGRRTAAQERDTRVRRLVEERETLRAELQSVREHRQMDRAEVERAQSLLPAKRQLDRIAALRAQGGDRDEISGLPADAPARYDELQSERKRLDRLLTELESELAERKATVERAESAAPVLARREEIIALVADAQGSAHSRSRTVELEADIADLEARVDAATQQLFAGPWRDVPEQLLASVPIERVRERLTRQREAEASVPAPGSGPPPWIVVVLGGALLVWGLVAELPLVTALGAAALAAGVTWWLAIARSGRIAADIAGGRSADPAGTTRRDGDGTSADVSELLRGLPLRPELLERPDEDLVTGLERIRDLIREREESGRALAASRERVTRIDARSRDLAASLGRETAGAAEGVARDLDRALRDAERLHDAAATAERDMRRLARERDDTAERARTVGVESDTIAGLGRALVSSDVRRGLEVGRARLAAHARADQLEDELEREHTDLAELERQIRELEQSDPEWSVDEEALARARARIEAHDERIEELLTRGEALDAEVNHLRDQDTVDAVDSEIASLREEETRLVRERDRKWILARLLREADRRFREEHQPDLVRRASSYLRHLTGGRYERLIVDEAHEDHLFQLVGPHLPAPVALAPPVSTGTLEQAYLSLRLAIVDHLDQGGERLPLFVDEILVNWDEGRRARGLEVLAGIASTRQVFVFTCHSEVAAELAERGGRVLRLGSR